MVSGDRRHSVDGPAVKKQKIDHVNSDHLEFTFAENLFDPVSVAQQRDEYVKSKPYKHSIFKSLFDPELLQSVQDEITTGLAFSQKETDIYKAC